ncbi:hypothetical protein [Actibacterium sp. XHP0104]|uniref:hypothetical protein n=1 Tax=Actibacterium sp. XHP0104 TaxID=2984335 RepID=UPI0021E7A47E|nr:hypothetical protein [Actibacterium sp. XHP0104]MCV2880739.1 hypothetical protein [Actibacterium sp. XHP0104]
MKTILIILAALAPSGPAFAHAGAHLHPHADHTGLMLGVLAALVVFAGAATVVIRGHK